MEKLQAAIEKAKARREGRADAEPPKPAGTEAPAPTAAAQTAAPETPAADPDPEPTPAAPAAEITPAPAPSSDERRALWAGVPVHTPATRTLRRHLVTLPDDPASTAPYDMLRTRVVHRMRREGWRRLLITSPNSACGKTTVASNLAMSLSRNPELHTILLDFDMRRPALAKMFGLRPKANLHEVLDGRSLFEDQAVRIGANLIVTANRAPARKSAELLQSDRTIATLDDIERRYLPDIMIFDMPPLIGSDDTHAFLPHCDCALLVAAAESTTIDQIDTAEKDLSEHLPVIGVTLNKCRYTDRDYGYGSY